MLNSETVEKLRSMKLSTMARLKAFTCVVKCDIMKT